MQKELERTPLTLVLWAWDRAEDLRFLKPGQAEVAGLMATIQQKDFTDLSNSPPFIR
jgi:hypothetical protein